MFARRARLIASSFVVNDLIATAVAFLLAYWTRIWAGSKGWLHNPAIYSFSLYLPILLAALLVFPFWGYALGAYQRVELRRPRDMASDVVKISMFGILSLFAGLFLLRGVPSRQWHDIRTEIGPIFTF